MVTKKQLEKLAGVLEDAADFAELHAETVKEAGRVFEEVFGVDVPEEGYRLAGNTPEEEVGSLFNNFVNYFENLSGTDSPLGLANKMAELMKQAKKERKE